MCDDFIGEVEIEAKDLPDDGTVQRKTVIFGKKVQNYVAPTCLYLVETNKYQSKMLILKDVKQVLLHLLAR